MRKRKCGLEAFDSFVSFKLSCLLKRKTELSFKLKYCKRLLNLCRLISFPARVQENSSGSNDTFVE